VRISAVIFACAFLFISVSTQAQHAPGGSAPAGPLPQPQPPAGKDGILTDTQGVDFKSYMQRMYRIVQSSWNPLIPKEVNPPVNKSGEVVIRFKILPGGKVMDGGMVLEGRSGDPALDRAAWGAIQTSVFPPLPAEFKGPYLELRFHFRYNLDGKLNASGKAPKAASLHGPAGVTLGYNSKF
jgi:TonB family protein